MGFIRKLIINWLCSIGFVIDTRIRTRGPKERLIYSDGQRGLSVLFNTMSGRITVGQNVVFEHDVIVLTGRDLFSDGNYKDIQKGGNDIVIKDGCWIASRAIILGGVTVGKGCLVCAGAVVTNDVPDNTMVAGVPAKFIKALNNPAR